MELLAIPEVGIRSGNGEGLVVQLRHLLQVVLSGSFALIFVVFFSTTTSFVHPTYGADSAIFRLVGTAMAHGQVPYVDIWDHKGPGLFLLQWLGQVIWPGRVGLFALQVISLTFSLWMIGRIALRFGSTALSIIAQVGFLAMLAPGYEYGNLSEEWSLPFVIFVLWGLTEAWHRDSGLARPWVLALSGAAFAYVVFIRLNNAAAIIAAFCAYFVYVLVAKKPFWRQMGLALIGFALMIAVFIIGFALVGALPEMLHGTFFYNFSYAAAETPDRLRLFTSGYLLMALGLGAITLLGGFTDALNTKRPWYLLTTMLLVLVGFGATLTPGTSFYHYLQLLAPGAALGLILLAQPYVGLLRVLFLGAALSFSLLVLAGYGLFYANRALASNDTDFVHQVEHLLAEVPQGERSGVFTLNVDSRYYLVSGELPVHRFYTLQDWWARADSIVFREINEYFNNTPPRWVIESSNPVENVELSELLDLEYEEVDHTANLTLLKRS